MKLRVGAVRPEDRGRLQMLGEVPRMTDTARIHRLSLLTDRHPRQGSLEHT